MVRSGLLGRGTGVPSNYPPLLAPAAPAIGFGRGPGVMPERFKMRTEENPAAERRPPITVALVDDEELIRVALAQALSSSGLELVGEAATGEDAIELVAIARRDRAPPRVMTAGRRPTQQRAGAPSGAPGLLRCQEAGVFPVRSWSS
jgi:hypothetical protein